jgi:hypothetical protein
VIAIYIRLQFDCDETRIIDSGKIIINHKVNLRILFSRSVVLAAHVHLLDIFHIMVNTISNFSPRIDTSCNIFIYVFDVSH